LRLLFFLAALIPTCIIAWRIDLVNDRIHPEPTVVEQPQVVRVTPQQKQPKRRTRRPNSTVDIAPAVENEPLPSTIERDPRAKPVPRPTQRIVFDFANKVQREPITLTGRINVAGIEGCTASLSPSDGNLEGEVIATLDGPRPVTVRITLQSREDERTLLIEPTVVNDAGKTVSFTKKTFESIARRVVKNGRTASSQVAEMNAERQRLQAWVDSPAVKPLLQRNQAIARIRELRVLIPEGEQLVAALEREARVIHELGAFAERLQNGCAIVVEAAEAVESSRDSSPLFPDHR
jgi:hypothetical protein